MFQAIRKQFKATSRLAGLALALALAISGGAYAAGSTGRLQTTPLPSKPSVEGARNVTGTSAYVVGDVQAGGSATHWHYESATSKTGPWTRPAGGEGTITQAEAEAEPSGGPYSAAEVRLTGLNLATTYYVRLVSESELESPAGSGEKKRIEVTSSIVDFETAGPPSATTFAAHAIHGEAMRVFASIDPDSLPTSDEQTVTIGGAPTGGTFTLTFKGQTTAPIAYNAPSEEGPGNVRQALADLPDEADVFVRGHAGGPYTLSFSGSEVAEPQMTADASGLTPSGTVTVVTSQEGGIAYDTHYHFEYVTQEQFQQPGGEGGFAKATSTPEVDLGSGHTQIVGEDPPSLQAGKTYEYRVVATSTAPGNPIVHGDEHTLTVPAPPASGGEAPAAPCPNEALRSGLSAHLPDCRAYEQITPADKEGALEIFKYSTAINGGALYSEDGEHVMVAAIATRWGAGPDAGQGPYFFSRTPSGWSMTAGAPQPEAGIDRYIPQIFGSDLTQFGFEAFWLTSFVSRSPDVEFNAGPPGGPYAKISVPRGETGLGWAAASEDLGKLVLAVEDHTLLGHATGTSSGNDLYEWSGGQLRQLNVIGGSPGTTIGSCGAKVVNGDEDRGAQYSGALSSVHAISADGSRVFFEAVPSSDCGEPSHLYMRVNGAETYDLGAYKFLAANVDGTTVLLEKRSGETSEVLLDETATATVKPLFSVPGEPVSFRVSEDLTAIYFQTAAQLTPEAQGAVNGGDNLYRYDIPTQTLRFIVQDGGSSWAEVSPDGRYYYFSSNVVDALPAGRAELPRGNEARYRYDSDEDVIECISCASPFDPEPRFGAETYESGGSLTSDIQSADSRPQSTFASADGDYAFFETASALVPQDVNGEVPYGNSSGEDGKFSEYPAGSPSNDVYEWRRDGLNGCAHIQGCLSLITPGSEDGVQVVVLGTDASGRDVFFYTHSQLVPQDNDTAGDIYDARIDGGFPARARSVECEGDACSAPENPPNDATPSSFTFAGVGNLVQPSAAKPAANGSRKSEQPKTKKRKRKKRAVKAPKRRVRTKKLSERSAR
jgi:hypothetical protein